MGKHKFKPSLKKIVAVVGGITFIIVGTVGIVIKSKKRDFNNFKPAPDNPSNNPSDKIISVEADLNSTPSSWFDKIVSSITNTKPSSSQSSSNEANINSQKPGSSQSSSNEANTSSQKPSSSQSSSNQPNTSSQKPSSGQSSSNQPNTSSQKPSSSQSSSSSNKNETMPSKLTASNINDVEVFKHFANKLNKESFPGVPVFRYGYSYKGKTYKTDGEKEFELFLTMLNYDSLNSSLLQQLFSNTDQETLKRYSFFMHTIINVITEKQIVYNFDKYMVDQGMGNFIKTYQQEYIKLLKGNSNKFKEMAIDYYINKSGAYHYGKANDFVEYFMFWLTKSGMDYDFSAKLDVIFVELEGKIEDNYDVSFVIVCNKASGKAKVLH